jgi:hypothetical protein
VLSIPTGDPDQYKEKMRNIKKDGKEHHKTPIYGRTHVLIINRNEVSHPDLNFCVTKSIA